MQLTNPSRFTLRSKMHRGQRGCRAIASLALCLGLLPGPAAIALQPSPFPLSNLAPETVSIAADITQIALEDQIYAAAFSADSRFLLTANADKTVRVFDAEGHQEVNRFSFDTGTDVSHVVFSPDGQYVAVVYDWDAVAVWSVQSGEKVTQIQDEALAPFRYVDGREEYAIAFSPDSRYLAVVVDDVELQAWDIQRGEFAGQVRYDAGLGRIAFSPDSRYVAATPIAGAVQVLDLQSGQPGVRIDPEFSDFGALAFSADSQQLTTAGDGTLISWDVQQGTRLSEFAPLAKQIMDDVTSHVYSSDGRYLATATQGNPNLIEAKVWDNQSGEVVFQWSSAANGVIVACFSPDNRSLMTAIGGRAQVWDIQTNQEIVRFEEVSSAIYSPDGRYIAALGENGVQLWDSRQRVGSPPIYYDDPVHTVAFSPDGQYLISTGFDFSKGYWSSPPGEPMRLWHESRSYVLAISSDSRYVASGDGLGSGELLIFDMQQPERSLDGPAWIYGRYWIGSGNLPNGPSTFLSAAFSPDSRYVATATAYSGDTAVDSVARLWSLEPNELLELPELEQFRHEGNVLSVAFSPDGRSLLTASEDDSARIWDIESGQETGRFTHRDDVGTAQFSPDGRSIVTASLDNTARLWNVQSGQEIAQLSHRDDVVQALFSPDGRYVATASLDSTARVWDAETGQEIAQFRHGEAVLAIAFSPDSRYVATASRDDTARVWNIETQQELSRFTHRGDVLAIAFSPDGQQVLSGSADKTAQLWAVPSAPVTAAQE